MIVIVTDKTKIDKNMINKKLVVAKRNPGSKTLAPSIVVDIKELSILVIKKLNPLPQVSPAKDAIIPIIGFRFPY